MQQNEENEHDDNVIEDDNNDAAGGNCFIVEVVNHDHMYCISPCNHGIVHLIIILFFLLANLCFKFTLARRSRLSNNPTLFIEVEQINTRRDY